MAVTARPYRQFLLDQAHGAYDLTATPLWWALLTDAYAPDPVAHTHYSDIIAAEVSATGTGYPTGGKQLTGVAVGGVDPALLITADPLTFDPLTCSVRYAALYAVTAAASPLIGLVDFGQTITKNNETLPLTASGGYISLVAGG